MTTSIGFFENGFFELFVGLFIFRLLHSDFGCQEFKVLAGRWIASSANEKRLLAVRKKTFRLAQSISNLAVIHRR